MNFTCHNIKTLQVEFWSILNDNIKYVQYNERTAHFLDVKTLDYRQHKRLYNKLKGEEGQTLDIDFGDNPDMLKTNYLDMYEGVHADMVYSNRFDENSAQYTWEEQHDKRNQDER